MHTIKRDKLLEVLDFYQAFANSFARNLVLTYNLRHRLIFRKVADVRREKELAEKRKNEPQLDQNQDHLVRKIFSKFRRDRAQHAAAQAAQHGTDIEKGEEGDSKSMVRVMSTTKLSSVAEKGDANITTKVTRPTTARPSKWGRLLGSSSLDSGSECSTQATQGFTRSLSAKDASKDRPSSSSSSSSNNQPPTGSGNKVFPKLQKVSSGASPGITRQDTIEEIVEVEQPPHFRNLNLRKMQSYDCGLRDPSSISLYNTPTPETIAPSEYKELLTNLMDFKVDVKLEIQRLNQKVGRIEEMLSELVKRLSPVDNGGSSSQSPQEQQQEFKPKSSNSGPERPTELIPRGEGGTGLGPLILRKRRSKSRTKGAAPQAPTPTSSKTPESTATSPTETTKMLEESVIQHQMPSLRKGKDFL